MFESDGLMQLRKDIPIIQRSRIIYVVTHPFFEDRIHPYINQLEALIRDATEPILTLECDVLLKPKAPDSTLKRYSRLNPNGDRFFLPNGYLYAKPDCGWVKTAQIINAFEPDEVVFGGSQLGGNETDGFYNCVGLVYRNLKERVPNARIDESISGRRE